MKSRVPAPSREDLLARVFHGSTQGMAVGRLDDGRILEANDAFLFLTARPRETVVGSSLFDLGLWSEVGDPATVRRLLRERGAIEGADASIAIPLGDVRVVRFWAEVIRDRDEPLVIVRATDVAGRAEAGARYHELREAEVKYRALVEQIPAITYTQVRDDTSPTGFVDLYISPQTSTVLGYAPEEWKADPELWIKILHPDDLERVLAVERHTADTGEPFRVEYRMIARDGRVVWFQDEAVLMEDPTSGVSFWQGLMLDITEEKRVHEQVREAELRYRSLVESLPAVVFMDALDEASTNIYTSPQTATMLGYASEEWRADPDLWRKLIHPEDYQRVMKAQQRYVDTGEPFDQEYRLFTREGRAIWVRDVAVTVENEDGEALFSQGFFLDITAQKEAEQALKEALRREREATGRLRALDSLKNTLLHTLSHDLKAPLTAILGAASTLEQPEVAASDEERHELLRSVASRARRMDKLLTDLLDLDRLDRGIVEPNRAPVDVGELVDNLVRECGEVLRGRHIEVQTEPAVVAADASKVERLVENLLSNAARHTPDGTRLWVWVSSEPDGALIGVEDEGPGVPDDLKEPIFEPFRRGPDAWHFGGTGIGLSLVARFAELHGGRAWVEDRPGGGSSFRVFLPGRPTG